MAVQIPDFLSQTPQGFSQTGFNIGTNLGNEFLNAPAQYAEAKYAPSNAYLKNQILQLQKQYTPASQLLGSLNPASVLALGTNKKLAEEFYKHLNQALGGVGSTQQVSSYGAMPENQYYPLTPENNDQSTSSSAPPPSLQGNVSDVLKSAGGGIWDFIKHITGYDQSQSENQGQGQGQDQGQDENSGSNENKGIFDPNKLVPVLKPNEKGVLEQKWIKQSDVPRHVAMYGEQFGPKLSRTGHR